MQNDGITGRNFKKLAIYLKRLEILATGSLFVTHRDPDVGYQSLTACRRLHRRIIEHQISTFGARPGKKLGRRCIALRTGNT